MHDLNNLTLFLSNCLVCSRYLSHKFHGKGPGKNKVEKRMKKGEQEVVSHQFMSYKANNKFSLMYTIRIWFSNV